jgi:hypothetical protein
LRYGKEKKLPWQPHLAISGPPNEWKGITIFGKRNSIIFLGGKIEEFGFNNEVKFSLRSGISQEGAPQGPGLIYNSLLFWLK